MTERNNQPNHIEQIREIVINEAVNGNYKPMAKLVELTDAEIETRQGIKHTKEGLREAKARIVRGMGKTIWKASK